MPVSFAGMLRVGQAAERLGVSIATLRRWSDAGLVPEYRTLGGQRRYLPEELDEVLAEQIHERKDKQ